MMVSVILPTRGRFDSLSRSVRSLLEKDSDLASVEILLGLDEDDAVTLADLAANPLPNCRISISPRHGYRYLHRYVNALCAEARGEWLFLWNDDALMETGGWDDVLRAHAGEFALLNPDSNHNNQAMGNTIFSIIPRTWFRAAGHSSLSNHNDTWLEMVAKGLGIMKSVPIRILHDRVDLTAGNDDQTAREREFTTGEFFGRRSRSLPSCWRRMPRWPSFRSRRDTFRPGSSVVRTNGHPLYR